LVKPPPVNWSVMVSALLSARFVNVATPPETMAMTVPWSGPAPLFSAGRNSQWSRRCLYYGVRAHQDIHQWPSIGRSCDGLLPVILPAQDLPWLWEGMLTAAFDLQTSRFSRTLHLRTRPDSSLASN
jgi:hypothetical protein